MDGLPPTIQNAIRDYADSVFVFAMTDDACDDDALFTELDDRIIAAQAALTTAIARAIARND